MNFWASAWWKSNWWASNWFAGVPVTADSDSGGFSDYPGNRREIKINWNRLRGRLRRRDEEELLFALGWIPEPPKR